MAEFTIHKGGAPGKTADSNEETIEKFRIFMLHTKQIENAIAVVHQLSKGFEWKELEDMCEKSRIDLRNMLTYVKKTYKDKVISTNEKPKLTLLRGEEDGMENIQETMVTEDT